MTIQRKPGPSSVTPEQAWRASEDPNQTEFSDSLALTFDRIFRPPRNFHVGSIKLGTAPDSHITLADQNTEWMNRQECHIIVSLDLRIFAIDYMSYYVWHGGNL